jgi:ABC-2 type transport system ATP-binding protein
VSAVVEPSAAVPAIAAEKMTRSFEDVVAVDAVDLAVPRGSLFGFLGPNGAGKSTTVRMLVGLLKPTSGSIRILGLDPEADPLAIRRQIGVVPDGAPLFERLSGREYLTFVGRMHGLPRVEIRRRTEELLELLDLMPDADKLIADYSHGMRKKIALSGAVIHGPRVVFLDEPFEGIDPVAARTIRDLLTGLAKRDVTVFLTSHILEIVDRLCTDVAILAGGRILASGKLTDLKATGTLEEVFLRTVGGGHEDARLSWID